MKNILSIDLEEWYHPEYVKGKVSEEKEERLKQNLNITLGLLSKRSVKATFFVVGELAEKYPEVIKRISEEGHEIGFHGYSHKTLWNLDAEGLREEIRKFDSFMSEKPIGFRAPSFSLDNRTKWALEVLEDAGYKYDSSIFPTKTPLYGVKGAPMKPYKPSHDNVVLEDETRKIWEFPLLVYPLFGLRLPMAGGFYLRLFPFNMLFRAVKKQNRKGFPAVIYLHTWELDPETPKLKLGLYKSFVTYHNMEKTGARLKHLLSRLEFTSIRNYMEETGLA